MKINVKHETNVYDFGAACRYLDVGPATLYRYIANGTVQVVKFSGKNLFMEKELQKTKSRIEDVTRHEKKWKRSALIIDVHATNFLMSTGDAADYLDMTAETVQHMARSEKLTGYRIGPFWIFRDNDLHAFLETYYGPVGLTHREISEKYGKKRTTVIEALKRNGVKPIGSDASRNHALLYHSSSLDWVAFREGWTPEAPKEPENR